MTRRTKSRSGSVMLETVLSVPALVLMIGAAIWSGELLWKRIHLTEVERQAAWGARMEVSPPREASLSKRKVGDWYQYAEAKAQDEITLPAWAENFFQPARVKYGGPRIKTSETVHGRGDGKSHAVYVRVKELDAQRTKPGEDLGPGPWYDLYNQDWPNAPSGGYFLARPRPVREYERYGQYVRLSK